jgi:hypothetical protein
MILPPKDISENDWLIAISLLLAYTAVFRLPRLFPKSIAILVMFFSLSVAKGADNTLGVPPLDLYDTNEIPKFDVTDLFTLGLYPAAGYLFIYAYHRLRIEGYAVPIYVVICSLLGTAYELLCVRFRVFEYKDWLPIQSFVTYLIAQGGVVFFFEWMKRVYTRGR